MQPEVAAILMSFWVNDPTIEAALRDPQTFWYDANSMPAVYQREGQVHHKTHNRSQNANNERPWNKPAGTDACKGVRSVKFLWLPKGERVVYWRVHKYRKGQGADDKPTVVWAFPPGSVVGELLIDEQIGLYEVRTRRRLDNDWESQFFRQNAEKDGKRIFEPDAEGMTPKGHVAVNRNCADCHRDTGLDMSFLPGAQRQRWKGKIRGSDGIFSFHPFVPPKSGFSRPPVIRQDIKHLIRERGEGEAFPHAVQWLNY